MTPAPSPIELSSCKILREDPELGEGIAPSDRGQAIDECVARTVRIPRGRWSVDWENTIREGIGLLVLDGLLLRRVSVGGRHGAELLGEGDVIRPWQGEDSAFGPSRSTGWRVLEPTRVAVLDVHAARRMAAYPELTGRLVGRALERARHLVVNMAIVHQAKVNVRIEMLLWHLADRWGRVRSEAVLVPLHLTHAVLADLVAARRPTVTTALSQLAREGRVCPARRGWLLFGEPPGELLELRRIAVGQTT